MTAGDLAAILVSIIVFAAFVVLLVVTQSLIKALRDLQRSLDTLQRETAPLLEELRATVVAAGAEVERVDDLLDAAESISATVESASRLSYLAFRAPLIKVVAFSRGCGRFVRRLMGRPSHRRSSRSGSRRSPGDGEARHADRPSDADRPSGRERSHRAA